MTHTFKPVSLILILALFAAIFSFSIMFLFPTLPPLEMPNEHAAVKHGSDAMLVKQCISDKGSKQVWFNYQTNRQASICEITNGMFGVDIRQKDGNFWSDITSFIKNKMSKIDQVETYLRNSGYERIQ